MTTPWANIFGPHGPGINESTVRPAAVADANTADTWFQPCVNGDPSTGTKVPSGLLNFILANLRNATRGMNVPDNETDDQLLLKAIQAAMVTALAIGSTGSGQSIIRDLTNGVYHLRSIRGINGIAVEVDADTNELDIDGSALLNAIPPAPVNADWNANGGLAQILNKPAIPAAQVQANWTQANASAADYIKNKPFVWDGTGQIPIGQIIQILEVNYPAYQAGTIYDYTVMNPQPYLYQNTFFQPTYGRWLCLGGTTAVGVSNGSGTYGLYSFMRES